MKLTKDNIGGLSLDGFVAEVAGVYSIQDEKRSIYDIWLHATHHAASVGEEVRKFKPGEQLFKEIADFAMWLFTFACKINVPLGSASNPHGIEETTIRVSNKIKFSDIIWNKYPELCPICFWRRFKSSGKIENILPTACDCLLYPVETRDKTQERKQLSNLHKYADQHSSNKPESVDQWQQMFRRIYEANLRHIDLEDIAFHLLEEVGEVSDAMVRSYTYVAEEFIPGEPFWRKTSLESEIADVSSWMFTLINHLELIPEIAREFQKYVFGETVMQEKPITLSGIIWKRYGDDRRGSLYCPHKCKKQVCECPIILVNNDEILGILKGY